MPNNIPPSVGKTPSSGAPQGRLLRSNVVESPRNRSASSRSSGPDRNASVPRSAGAGAGGMFAKPSSHKRGAPSAEMSPGSARPSKRQQEKAPVREASAAAHAVKDARQLEYERKLAALQQEYEFGAAPGGGAEGMGMGESGGPSGRGPEDAIRVGSVDPEDEAAEVDHVAQAVAKQLGVGVRKRPAFPRIPDDESDGEIQFMEAGGAVEEPKTPGGANHGGRNDGEGVVANRTRGALAAASARASVAADAGGPSANIEGSPGVPHTPNRGLRQREVDDGEPVDARGLVEGMAGGSPARSRDAAAAAAAMLAAGNAAALLLDAPAVLPSAEPYELTTYAPGALIPHTQEAQADAWQQWYMGDTEDLIQPVCARCAEHLLPTTAEQVMCNYPPSGTCKPCKKNNAKCEPEVDARFNGLINQLVLHNRQYYQLGKAARAGDEGQDIVKKMKPAQDWLKTLLHARGTAHHPSRDSYHPEKTALKQLQVLENMSKTLSGMLAVQSIKIGVMPDKRSGIISTAALKHAFGGELLTDEVEETEESEGGDEVMEG